MQVRIILIMIICAAKYSVHYCLFIILYYLASGVEEFFLSQEHVAEHNRVGTLPRMRDVWCYNYEKYWTYYAYG